MQLANEALPDYAVFDRVCRSGLSQVRPLKATADTASDPWGWNFGQAGTPSYAAFGRMRALLSQTEASRLQPRTVLEVAAGDASLCASLAKDGVRVAANDLRRETLAQGVQAYTNGDSIAILPGDLFELDPEQTGRFDLVIACEVIEHVAHSDQFLRQLSRFVAPGGHILLTTPNGSYFRNQLPTHSQIEDFAALESMQFKPDADGHLFLITPEELEGIARQAGLRVDRLLLWGTPAITGHAGLAALSSTKLSWFWYQLENASQRLPMALRKKLCFALSAVLKPLA